MEGLYLCSKNKDTIGCGTNMQLMWAFFTYAKIWFSYDADDLCSCIVLSYRFLKCNKKKEKKKFVVFNAMPFSISEVKDKQ